MVSPESEDIVSKLNQFYSDFKSYQSLLEYLKESKTILGHQLRERDELREKLVRKTGELKQIIVELTGKQYVKQWGQVSDIWNEGLVQYPSLPLHTISLSYCIDATNEAIGKLKSDIEMGIRDKQGNVRGRPYKTTTEPPKAFVAHKGETKSLDKLKTFLDALGIKYLIAEVEPSNGRLVEGQVTWTYRQADFAIILATKGGVINKKTGTAYMGMNVADELGRAREVFKNRIILLLETGVESHTNISGIVHERFTPQSMDKAFIKIAKELKNWGFIRARKLETEKNV